MAHARIQPSSLSRILECPASIRLSEEFPVIDKGSPAAEAGTVQHQMFERAMQGREIEPDVVEFENLIAANYCPKRAIRNVKMSVVAAEKLLSTYSAINVVLEQKVLCGAAISRDDFWGTADVLAWNNRTQTLVVADLKTGLKRVNPEENPQLLAYAMGARRVVAWRPTKIVLAIIQPTKCGIKPAVWETETEYLDRFAERVAAAISEIEKAEPRPSDSACQYCPARQVCAAPYPL